MTHSGWDQEEASAKGVDSEYTLAGLLFYFKEPQRQRDLEDFRVRYEAEYGPTDLTRRYTSLWPEDQQKWLSEHDPKRYFDGLPPFVQAYLQAEIKEASKSGTLDTLPTHLIRLLLSKKRNDRGPDRL